ncbi:MAG: endo-1,4-beta-xylanase [Bacteroidales bacterium]|nr:endo-1,4-beta-xylanase [Bacteroidales bacterium]
MKRFYVLVAIVAFLITFSACSKEEDDIKPNTENDSKNQSNNNQNSNNQSNLSDYSPLKTYITNPNFKLGCAISANGFLTNNTIFNLCTENFTEIVADNDMKYSSCVKNNGSMDFSTVEKFVEKAKQNGIGIYGHTLCWHSQQNINYLKSILEDKTRPVEGGKPAHEVTEERRCIKISSADMIKEPWETQFWIVIDKNKSFKTGDSYEFSASIRADIEATIGTQSHTTPGEYKHYVGVGSLPFKTTWDTYIFKGNFTSEQEGCYSIAFDLNDYDKANIYYFDDISFKINGVEMITNGDCENEDNTCFVSKEKNGNLENSKIINSLTYIHPGDVETIPLTKQEVYDTVYYALSTWIEGMMKACDGYVLAWDVVNEALSGADKNGDGKYDLQSKNNVSADEAQQNFYWTDYLGENFVRDAVALARKHGAKYGAENLKLFINDYNLESTWDDNQKLKSLIKWIEQWESDGITKIDGIGTQMHINYYADPQSQKSTEEHVVEMFKLMASSGKLCRISELDMGYVDGVQFQGNNLKNSQMTVSKHKQMADFYKFIVSKYLEIIPVEQQYGICHWCPTDSPENSSWRGGEPVGLWTETFARKQQFAGFAEGLKSNNQ